MQDISGSSRRNQHTTWYEYVAVVYGIASVWFSSKENILVYPVGWSIQLFIFHKCKGRPVWRSRREPVLYHHERIRLDALGKKGQEHQPVVRITGLRQRMDAAAAFLLVSFTCDIFLLTYLKKDLLRALFPVADAFASATAFTGMWLMAKKKVESWYWWIATNISFCPALFCQRIGVHEFLLPGAICSGGRGTDRLEEKSQ